MSSKVSTQPPRMHPNDEVNKNGLNKSRTYHCTVLLLSTCTFQEISGYRRNRKLAIENIVAYFLKARTVKPADTPITRERL
jgi:hypothetical protein